MKIIIRQHEDDDDMVELWGWQDDKRHMLWCVSHVDIFDDLPDNVKEKLQAGVEVVLNIDETDQKGTD